MKYEKYQVDLEIVLSEYHALGFIRAYCNRI